MMMDDDVYPRSKTEVPAKKLSACTAKAVQANPHPDTRLLNAAYRAARKERWRKALCKDWKHIDDE
ncbi:MAG: hypothetical protein EWM72_01301 [Nitrospira sp.]|nr:MAG: hypothetical protein EWM72_01301 [Nitrospira sp.]